jgi:hypothetical protein
MNHSSSEYRIVRANHDNIKDLSWLFKESRGLDISVKYLQNKYNTAYTKKSYLAHFAYAKDGTPAAFFCFFPGFLRINGDKKLSGQSADIITHKDHQRKGLFGLLGRETEKLALEEGVNYLFAFPNDKSFPGFTRSLNWHHSGDFHQYIFKNKGIPLFKFFRKLRLQFLYKIWTSIIIRNSTKPNDTFLNSQMISNDDSSWKDNDFYQYKHYNSSFNLNWKGLSIWAKIDGALIIGDMDISKNYPAKEIINKLKSLTSLLGLEHFTFSASNGSELDKLFNEDYPFVMGVPIVFKNLQNPEQNLPLKFTGADLDVF